MATVSAGIPVLGFHRLSMQRCFLEFTFSPKIQCFSGPIFSINKKSAFMEPYALKKMGHSGVIPKPPENIHVSRIFGSCPDTVQKSKHEMGAVPGEKKPLRSAQACSGLTKQSCK